MAKHDKQAKADGSAVEAAAGAETKLTRRSFVAKAGLTAAALGVAGSIPAVAASCGSSTTTSSASGGATAEPTVIRFVFAPDPVWNYMKDTGIVAKWEERYNFKIVNTTTWDETAWFVGGHADIASMGTYEVPLLEQSSGKEFVSFGRYNCARDSVYIRSDSSYKSMEDLVGKRVATSGTGASMILEAAMWQALYGLDFRVGGGDFKVSMQELVGIGATLEKGDVEMGCDIIDFEISYMQTGKHNWLYPDLPTDFEFYWQHFNPQGTREHVMSNLWVTTPKWYDANQKVAEGFNVMWQEGVNAWYANKETIVKAYPDLFTTKNQAEVDWFLKYMEKHDQCVTSVYMDEAWIKEESALLPFLKEQGKIKENVPDSKFIAMTSPTNVPPEAQVPTAAPAATPAASPSA